jgi:hypothetical protein
MQDRVMIFGVVKNNDQSFSTPCARSLFYWGGSNDGNREIPRCLAD